MGQFPTADDTAAKARGVKLGGPKLATARKQAIQALKTAADRHAANVLPVIHEVRLSPNAERSRTTIGQQRSSFAVPAGYVRAPWEDVGLLARLCNGSPICRALPGPSISGRSSRSPLNTSARAGFGEQLILGNAVLSASSPPKGYQAGRPSTDRASVSPAPRVRSQSTPVNCRLMLKLG